MRDALAATVLLFFSTLFLAGMSLAAPVDATRTVAAIFPPWYGKPEVIRAIFDSGVDMVRHGGIETVALVRLHSPEDIAKLKNAGALAVIGPEGLFGCTGLNESAGQIFRRKAEI